MTRRAFCQPENGVGAGSVRGDELLSLKELGRRLRLGQKSLAAMQRAGLRTASFGKAKFVVGRWLLEFAEQRAAGAGPTENMSFNKRR